MFELGFVRLSPGIYNAASGEDNSSCDCDCDRGCDCDCDCDYDPSEDDNGPGTYESRINDEDER